MMLTVFARLAFGSPPGRFERMPGAPPGWGRCARSTEAAESSAMPEAIMAVKKYARCGTGDEVDMEGCGFVRA